MSGSATAFYYVDNANQRQGPIGEDEVHRLIGEGVIAAGTRVWTAGMPEWREAASTDRLARFFESTVVMPPPRGAAARPPSFPAPAAGDRPPAPAPSPGAGFQPPFGERPTAPTFSASATPRSVAVAATGPLIPDLPIWGLFGRALLAAIGSILIVPSPWTSTMVYRFLCEHTAMPGGARLRFTGLPLDIWLVFILIGLAGWLRLVPYGGLVGLLISAGLMVLVLRWFCSKVETARGPLNLSFQGGVLPYIGWNVLLILSFITIVGWAWVMQYMMRWICQNVRGAIGFEFHGTGLEILWRSLVFGLGAMFLIPIPWLLRWYMNWFISRVHAVPASA